MKQPMAAFMCHRCPQATVCGRRALSVQFVIDYDRFDAAIPEFGKAEHAVRQILVCHADTEALLDKPINWDRCWVGGEKAGLVQLVGADLLDLFQTKIRPFEEGARCRAGRLHRLSLRFLCASRNLITSLGSTVLSRAFRSIIPYAGFAAASRLNSCRGARVSCFRKSVTVVPSARAISTNTSSDGWRRPSSTSDKNAADNRNCWRALEARGPVVLAIPEFVRLSFSSRCFRRCLLHCPSTLSAYSLKGLCQTTCELVSSAAI